MRDPIEVTNRVETRGRNKTYTSNLVYPLDYDYFYYCKLDREFVERRLGGRICNKYCIEFKNNGFTMLVTNHDGSYWLTLHKSEATK